MKGFTDWINSKPNNLDESGLKRIWHASHSYKKGYVPNVEKGHELFLQRIKQEKSAPVGIIAIKRYRLVWRLAATIALLLVAGVFWKQYADPAMASGQLATTDEEIKVWDLQDGTQVTLNGESTLNIAEDYGTQDRSVELTGEAFFAVARDEARPFAVRTENAVIEVLGTSFNVRSFSTENVVEVFVKSGSVKVTFPASNDVHLLSPGELLRVDVSTASEIEKVADIDGNAIAWKTGKFTLKEQPVSELFLALERKHKIRFEMQNPNMEDCPYTINSNISELEEILAGLNMACGLKFTKKSDQLYEISGSCCD